VVGEGARTLAQSSESGGGTVTQWPYWERTLDTCTLRFPAESTNSVVDVDDFRKASEIRTFTLTLVSASSSSSEKRLRL